MIKRVVNLEKLLSEHQSAFLLGPRGTGKSVLSTQYLSTRKHSYNINLLHLDIYRRYLTDPSLFRREIESKIPTKGVLAVLIDEVQKLPALLDEVHNLIESHKRRVQFLLTGSSARKLKRGRANLLAGRAWKLSLHPLCSLEIDIELEKALRYGTLPAIYLEDTAPERTLQAYVDVYLREEIMQESLVRKVDNFVRFLDVAAQMNAEPINFSNLAKEAGVAVKTTQEYFSILEDTLIAFRLNGWSHSLRKQLLQAPKFYFFDCGVINAFQGELKSPLKQSSFRYGKLFESLVIQEGFRLNDYFEANFSLQYWRTNTNQEVDLILNRGARKKPFAIEIKSKPNVSAKDLSGLFAFASDNKGANLFCLCQTPEKYVIEDIPILPWQSGLREIFKKALSQDS